MKYFLVTHDLFIDFKSSNMTIFLLKVVVITVVRFFSLNHVFLVTVHFKDANYDRD